MLIHQHAAVTFRAGRRQQAAVGAHANRHHQHVKLQLLAGILQHRHIFLKLRHAIAHNELNAAALQITLHNRGGLGVQNAAQHPVSQIHHANLLNAFGNAFHAFQANQARAHHQHPALRRNGCLQSLRVCQRHKGEAFFHAVQPFGGRHKRLTAAGCQQLFIGHGAAVGQAQLLVFRVNLLHLGLRPQQRLHLVLLVKICRTIQHALLVGAAQQQIGNQRPGIGVIRLIRQQQNFPLRIHPADSLHTANRPGGIADDYVFSRQIGRFFVILAHRPHLSSKTIARLGQAATQAGVPPLARLVQSSHFCIT